MGKLIYTDNAATTPLDKDVLNAMMPYLTENYGNASSIYSIGRQAKQAITTAREQVSNALNCHMDEGVFYKRRYRKR
jgi:cysteine desulfurase